MEADLAVFLGVAVIMLASAILVFQVKEVIHSVIFLAITFLSVAALFILLNAELLAIIQILIYVGAVVVLMLFAVILVRRRIIVWREKV